MQQLLEPADPLGQPVELAQPPVGVEVGVRTGRDRERAPVQVRLGPGHQGGEALDCVHDFQIVRAAAPVVEPAVIQVGEATVPAVRCGCASG